MELNQVHRTSCVGLAEYVKNSTDDRMRFVHEQENNRPEKGSLIHLATNFQKQSVQGMNTTQENEIETNTVPLIAKKKKRKTTKRNISRYTLTNGRMTKEQED